MSKLARIKSAQSASPNWTVDQVIEIIKVIPDAVQYQHIPHNINLIVYMSYNLGGLDGI